MNLNRGRHDVIPSFVNRSSPAVNLLISRDAQDAVQDPTSEKGPLSLVIDERSFKSDLATQDSR
jgi:hypothetical protein